MSNDQLKLVMLVVSYCLWRITNI